MLKSSIAENIIEISSTTGILLDPVYNIKAVRGMLKEMTNNPGRFKGRRILYIHTGMYVLLHKYRRLPLISPPPPLISPPVIGPSTCKQKNTSGYTTPRI